MNQLRITAITIFLACLPRLATAQDFIFNWEIHPSFSSSYSVIIKRMGNIRRAYVVKEYSDDTLTYSVELEDIERLQSFLESYDFPERGSRKIDSVGHQYLPTIFPDNSTRSDIGIIHDSTVVVGADTLHAGWVRYLKGYRFDSIKRQYYQTIEYGSVWTDGTTYTGRYETKNINRSYSLFSARFSEEDLKLNEMILDIITKKERLLRYLEIQQEIQSIRIRN